MKNRTTAKAVRAESGKKLAVSYCHAQNLLRYHSPVAYTCGIYGWNFDVYQIDGVTICTGYRGMVGKHADYDLLREYEQAAERIAYDNSIEYDEKKARVEALLKEFLETA